MVMLRLDYGFVPKKCLKLRAVLWADKRESNILTCTECPSVVNSKCNYSSAFYSALT